MHVVLQQPNVMGKKDACTSNKRRKNRLTIINVKSGLQSLLLNFLSKKLSGRVLAQLYVFAVAVAVAVVVGVLI